MHSRKSPANRQLIGKVGFNSCNFRVVPLDFLPRFDFWRYHLTRLPEFQTPEALFCPCPFVFLPLSEFLFVPAEWCRAFPGCDDSMLAFSIVGVLQSTSAVFRPTVLSGVCLCGKRLAVAELLPGAGKFRDRQVAGYAQLGSLVCGLSLAERAAPEHLFAVAPFGCGITPADKRFAGLVLQIGE